MRTFDIIGNLVLALGFIIAAVSIVGILAARTNARPLLFLYFMSILLVSYLLLLAVVRAAGCEALPPAALSEGGWRQHSPVLACRWAHSPPSAPCGRSRGSGKLSVRVRLMEG